MRVLLRLLTLLARLLLPRVALGRARVLDEGVAARVVEHERERQRRVVPRREQRELRDHRVDRRGRDSPCVFGRDREARGQSRELVDTPFELRRITREIGAVLVTQDAVAIARRLAEGDCGAAGPRLCISMLQPKYGLYSP